jgi:hypothetical protein
MVNSTASSSSPTTPAINQHSGLTSQANEEGCNDDPPPIPQPPAGGTGHASDIHRLPAGGFHLPNNQPDNLTTRPQVTGEHISTGEFATSSGVHGIRIRDYGASPSSSSVELHVTSSNEISSETAVTSDAASTNSSTTAVDPPYGDSVIDIAPDRYDRKNPHTVEASAVATVLRVNLAYGLTTADANEKFHQDGPNKLTSNGGITWYGVLLRQISNSLTLVCDPVTLFATFQSF